MLFHSGSAVVASTAAAKALGTEPLGRDREPSNDLQVLIGAHKAAYASFSKALHETDWGSRHLVKAGREEERALLAICAYAAVKEGDRLAKSRFLLEIEARGELDLAEHMQALLRSTMWEG
ncbi:hypothetical protein [Mesorhizobium sangaii]|uniref:Uncharacterized protein n=1 Tax=Mesorhizobium sangaii TaxID=505389 RepID=A0A841PS30_9HYPH|nr:hypothetical protein [Mesorhizobium sangaii]MBB6411185.1 hypothetical protein [Mesorhizobium sangaii]